MPKPQWLIDREMKAEAITMIPNMCKDCIYYGSHVKMTKHRGKEWVDVHECDIHPNCFNTKYSICCEDFTRPQLI